MEGFGFGPIGRILKISYSNFFYWVKSWGDEVKLLKRENAVEVAKIDAMHTFINKKRLSLDIDDCWLIWKGASFFFFFADAEVLG